MPTYEVLKPFEFYTQIGQSESNAYVGRSVVYRGVFRKERADIGDLVVLGYPSVLVSGSKVTSINLLTKPKDGAFEKSHTAPVEYTIQYHLTKRGILAETDKQTDVNIKSIRNQNEKILKPGMSSVVASVIAKGSKMDLNKIAKNVFRKAISPEADVQTRIVTKQSQLMRSALALIKIFFGNEQDFREGVGKIKMLMQQGMTGIETKGMTPEQTSAAAEQVAKSIWVKFNNAIPNDIKFRVAIMRQALSHIIGALFGAEEFKRSTFTMLDKKLGIDIETLGYTGDAKEELFNMLYMAMRNAIKAAAPQAVNKI